MAQFSQFADLVSVVIVVVRMGVDVEALHSPPLLLVLLDLLDDGQIEVLGLILLPFPSFQRRLDLLESVIQLVLLVDVYVVDHLNLLPESMQLGARIDLNELLIVKTFAKCVLSIDLCLVKTQAGSRYISDALLLDLADLFLLDLVQLLDEGAQDVVLKPLLEPDLLLLEVT